MNKKRKFLSLFCAAALACTAFAACGPSESYDGEVIDEENDYLSGTLNLRVWDGGYGTDWTQNVADKFNEKYPDVKINIKTSVERQEVFGDITGKSEKYDIIFAESNVKDYTDCLTNLDDVYDYTNKGETTKVGEKISEFERSQLNWGGSYYQIPSYVGAFGLVCNATYLEELGESEPVTTDELKALCAAIKNKTSTKAIIFSGENGTDYWNWLYCTWYAQYEGRAAYSASLQGKRADGTVDPAVAYLQGGMEAMQVCEDLLWYPNGYVYEQSTGLQFLLAQRDFLNGNAVMMYNGSWMMNEMSYMFSDGTDYDFKMVKTPVISAIKDKCTTIENDAELAALVRAIDAGTTDLTGTGYDVNEADFATVKEARSFYYAGGENAAAVIPVNARNKTLAKRFLSFMYSDEGIKAHAAAKAGCVLPVQGVDFGDAVDTTDTFLKSAYDILFTQETFFNDYTKPITPWCTNTVSVSIEKQFGSVSAADRVRASVSFAAKKNLWTAKDNDKFWTELISAGVIDSKP